LLEKLQGSRQIPYLAIFPAGQPEKVIRLPGLYSRNQLIEALNQAGASKSVANDVTDTHISAEKPPVVMSRLP